MSRPSLDWRDEMLIFNVFTVVELFAIFMPALLAAGLAHFVGIDGEWVGTLVAVSLIGPLDLVLRLALGGGDDGERKAPGALLRLIHPRSGAHLFFLPVWLVAIPLA